MNFASDNWAGATPAVAEALNRANGGYAPAYGDDALTAKVRKTFNDIFEREVEVHFMGTGTAANALCMSLASRPSGYVFCTTIAHLHTDEFNATEFFTGMKLMALPAEAGLMSAAGLEAGIASLPAGHSGPPSVLSLTNASEVGTAYAPARVAELAAIAKAHGMLVHVDGARFANAVAATGASPADLTWRAGVDLMSFGGTKNGCWAAEAVIVFEPGRFPDLVNIRQRAGQGMSKTRFIAAQFDGYFADSGWIATAAYANAMSARLSDGLARSNAARLPWRSTANEVFPVISNETAARLRDAGAVFHTWEPMAGGEQLVRLVTSFATTEEEVDRFLSLL